MVDEPAAAEENVWRRLEREDRQLGREIGPGLGVLLVYVLLGPLLQDLGGSWQRRLGISVLVGMLLGAVLGTIAKRQKVKRGGLDAATSGSRMHSPRPDRLQRRMALAAAPTIVLAASMLVVVGDANAWPIFVLLVGLSLLSLSVARRQYVKRASATG